MNLWKSWAVATKDFDTFRTKRLDLYSLVAASLVLSIGLPILMWLLMWRTAISSLEIVVLLNAFSFSSSSS